MKLERVFMTSEKFDKVCDYLENQYMKQVENNIGYIFKLMSPRTREIDENTIEVRNTLKNRVFLRARAERISDNETCIKISLIVDNMNYIIGAIVMVITCIGTIGCLALVLFRNSKWKGHFFRDILPPITQNISDIKEAT